MDTLGAMRATLEKAKANMEEGASSDFCVGEHARMPHLESMLERCNAAVVPSISAKRQSTMSEGKINRWLGYMQGVLVARDILTLDECKEINKDHAG